MRNPSLLHGITRSVIFGTAFFGTVIGLSYVYAALSSGLTVGDLANGGSTLSSASWNRVVNSILELDARTSSISASSGKISVNGAVQVGDTSNACTSANYGSIRFTGGAFEGCTSDGWSPFGNGYKTIVANGSGRKWSDNTYATNCNGYKNPVGGYAYSGLTGNGIYTISPSGTAFDVYCDMTTDGGGWTLVIYNPPSSTALGGVTGDTGTVPSSVAWSGTPHKLSDTKINSISKGSYKVVTQTGWIRYWKGACVFNATNVVSSSNCNTSYSNEACSIDARGGVNEGVGLSTATQSDGWQNAFAFAGYNTGNGSSYPYSTVRETWATSSGAGWYADGPRSNTRGYAVYVR